VTAAGRDDDSLEVQREWLAQVREWEAEIRGLRDRERDLEVDLIAARVALESAPAGAPALDPPQASVVAAALEQRREAQAALAGVTDSPAGDRRAAEQRLERVTDACEALRMWRDAPGAERARRIPRVAHAVLVAVCVAAVWGAIAVHPALLVLIVPVAIPIGYLGLRGQDTAWVRLGAERRLREAGLAPPDEWSEAGVEARIEALAGEQRRLGAEIEAARAADAHADAEPEQAGRELALAMQVAEAEDRLVEALAGTGIALDAIDAPTEQWLARVRRVDRLREQLAETARRRKALAADVERARSEVLRYLRRHDAVPAGGSADTSTLEAALDRVARGQRARAGRV